MANKAMLFMQQINNQIEDLKNQDSRFVWRRTKSKNK